MILFLKAVLCKKPQVTYLQLVIYFGLVPFYVKVYVLQDLAFRAEVRELSLYLFLIEV